MTWQNGYPSITRSDLRVKLVGTEEKVEVVAELSAAVIAFLLGYKIELRQVKY